MGSGLLLIVAAFAGCTSFGDIVVGGALDDGGPGDTLPDGAPRDGGGPLEPEPEPTDPEECRVADPAEHLAACVNESTGVFVDGSRGVDQDNHVGSRAQPFKTLGAAVARLALDERRYVFVAAGSYAESVQIPNGRSLSFFAGYTENFSKRPERSRSILQSQGPAFTYAQLRGPVRLHDWNLQVSRGDDALSAVGVALSGFDDTASATLARTRLAVAPGVTGARGVVLGEPVERCGITAANPHECSCVLVPESVAGGAGGANNVNGGSPGSGAQRGSGGGANFVGCGSGGGNGNPGSSTPAAGAVLHGSLVAGRWTPAAGESSSPSTNGGGGGGGGGGISGFDNKRGGRGGVGGCGGRGVAGSAGGGASLGLLLDAVALQLLDCEIVVGEGAAGAEGGTGDPVQPGRPGAPGECSRSQGGTGGDGAASGASGGGAGGLSAGILFRGTRPVLDAATVAAIQFGEPGAGGARPDGETAIAGVAGAVLQLGDDGVALISPEPEPEPDAGSDAGDLDAEVGDGGASDAADVDSSNP